jgi:hypothetical protein
LVCGGKGIKRGWGGQCELKDEEQDPTGKAMVWMVGMKVGWGRMNKVLVDGAAESPKPQPLR